MRLLPEQFDKKISSVRIEGWTSSSEFSQSVFMDEFDQMGMDEVWEWEDPRGHGQWTEHQGYLQMNVDSGVDLWHGTNYDAPRLIQPIQGNFTIETRMPVTSQLREHGGLLVWKGPWAFLRLEKTSGAHSFQGDVRFERHFSGGYRLIGRGSRTAAYKTSLPQTGAGRQPIPRLCKRRRRQMDVHRRNYQRNDRNRHGRTARALPRQYTAHLHAVRLLRRLPKTERSALALRTLAPTPMGTQPTTPIDDSAAENRPNGDVLKRAKIPVFTGMTAGRAGRKL